MRCKLKDKERFALAERIQKKIQEKHPHFQFIKRRSEIEKQFEVKIGGIDHEPSIKMKKCSYYGRKI